MSSLYVLSELRYQLEVFRAFGSIYESNDVIANILGQLPENTEQYLSTYRDKFVNELSMAKDSSVQGKIEALISNLSVLWSDAKDWHDNVYGESTDENMDSVINVYYSETINYIALVYKFYLSLPKKEYYQFWERFPRLEKKAVHDLLVHNKQLDEKTIFDLEAAVEALNNPLEAPPSYISRNLSMSRMDSLSNLRTFIYNTIDNIKHKQQIHESDWEFIEVKNKEIFYEQVLDFIKDSTDTSYTNALYIVDIVARLYHDVRLLDMTASSSKSEASINSRCEELLESYLGIILMHCQVFPPAFCLYRMIKDLDIDVRVSWRYLMDRMAVFNDRSKSLNNKMQSAQCSKCKMSKCYGRCVDRIRSTKHVGHDSAGNLIKPVFSGQKEITQPLVHASNSTVPSTAQVKNAVAQKPVTDNTDFLAYLNALKDEGYLDDSYKWIKTGHTNYHAGWAARIIIANADGIHYDTISKIIGVDGLADYASKCDINDKKDKKVSIEACFKRHGLSTSTS